MALSEEARARLAPQAADIIARYPRTRSALLPLLHLVQSEEGYVSQEGIEFCAEQLGLTERTVCLWRRRYQHEVVDGLRSRRRSGRPRSITGAKEFAVVTASMRRPRTRPIGARGGWLSRWASAS